MNILALETALEEWIYKSLLRKMNMQFGSVEATSSGVIFWCIFIQNAMYFLVIICVFSAFLVCINRN